MSYPSAVAGLQSLKRWLYPRPRLIIDREVRLGNFDRADVGYEVSLAKEEVARRYVLDMLRPGGICITIAPFALRYHESPADHFRYTHTGLASLFEDAGAVTTLVAGYDLQGRRNNWQGLGSANDICPVDSFGAWRENWFTVCVVEKLRS